jgi:hypothetical protein
MNLLVNIDVDDLSRRLGLLRFGDPEDGTLVPGAFT